MKKEKSRDQVIHEEALKRFKRTYEAGKCEREKMRADLRFARGEQKDQWDSDALQDRGKTRPALTINRMGSFERQIMGDIRQNNPSIRAIPQEENDKEKARILQGIIRYIQNNSNSKMAYKTAATMAVRCGYGVIKVATEYSSDYSFEQDVKIKRVLNPLSVWFDPDSEELTKCDGKFAFESRLFSEEEFERKYPKAEKIDWDALGDDAWYWRHEEKIRVVSYWVREETTNEIGLFETADGPVISDVTEENRRLAKKTRKTKSTKVFEYKLNGHQIIEGPNVFPGSYIPLIPVYGEEHFVDGEATYKGIIRDAKDAQKMYNLWRTSGMETIAAQPKSPWVLTTTQVAGHESRWTLANKTALPYLLYNPDSTSPPPMRQPPPQPPSAMWQEAQIVQDDMKAVIGIYDAALGNRSNETSGRAILARQRESDVSNFHFMDNLALAMEHAGRILIDVIPKVYDTARMIRILGEDEQDEIVQINSHSDAENDITTGKYDVSISVGPSYTTKREEMADFLIEMMKINPRIAEVASDLIVKNMDLAGADVLAERLKKIIPSGIVDPDEETEEGQMQMQMAQMQQQFDQMMQDMQRRSMELGLEKQSAEIDALEAKTLKDQATATKDLTEIGAQIAPLVEQAVLQTLQGFFTSNEGANRGEPGMEIV